MIFVILYFFPRALPQQYNIWQLTSHVRYRRIPPDGDIRHIILPDNNSDCLVLLLYLQSLKEVAP
jgi:hypothetical protein